MNTAVIFAGGVGQRMHAKDKPKQFLCVLGKPIIVHTIEIFEKSKQIDQIIVVCVEDWIDYMKDLQYRYRLDKITAIVPGGETGQLSIYNGIKKVAELSGEEDHIVLIHDGVRPLISTELIEANIQSVKKYGSAISCAFTKETFVIKGDDGIGIKSIEERSLSMCAKAPQSFRLKDILQAHEWAMNNHIYNSIDSCTLMHLFGKDLSIVECGNDNIKITTPNDFFIFRALYDARENQQLNY